jgi:hypothetical protein
MFGAPSHFELTDDELSALIEACNVVNNHPGEARPPWNRAGHAAHDKLINEERRRSRCHSFDDLKSFLSQHVVNINSLAGMAVEYARRWRAGELNDREFLDALKQCGLNPK